MSIRRSAMIAVATLGLATLLGTASQAEPSFISRSLETETLIQEEAEKITSLPEQNSPEISEWLESVGGDEWVKKREAMNRFNEWIVVHPELPSAGYVELESDVENLAIVVLWNGEQESHELAALIDAAKVEGISVTTKAYPHSVTEIDTAIQKLWAGKEELAARGFNLSGIVGLPFDSTNVTLEGTFSSAEIEKRNSAELQVIASGIAGMPVSIRGDSATINFARNNDYSAFLGGAYLNSSVWQGTIRCTTGFTLRHNGINKITTARHCVPAAGGAEFTARDNNGNWAGKPDGVSPDYGALFLNHSNWQSRGSGYVWNGDPYTTSTTRVAGYQDVHRNDEICSNGGNSGVHCGLVINDMMFSFDDGHGAPFYTIKALNKTNGELGAAAGDSGGMLLVPWSNGFGAVGMIQGGTTAQGYSDDHCRSKGVRDIGDGLFACTRDVAFPSTRSLAQAWGASLVTG